MSTTFTAAPVEGYRHGVSSQPARALLMLAIITAVAAALLAGKDTASQADPDLTHLLRAMAAMKALMSTGAAAAIFWRLGTAVSLPWLGCYAMAGASMAARPVVIWDMAYVSFGALMLHGGLLASVLLLWRDPVVGASLSVIIAKRRAALRVE